MFLGYIIRIIFQCLSNDELNNSLLEIKNYIFKLRMQFSLNEIIVSQLTGIN